MVVELKREVVEIGNLVEELTGEEMMVMDSGGGEEENEGEVGGGCGGEIWR